MTGAAGRWKTESNLAQTAEVAFPGHFHADGELLPLGSRDCDTAPLGQGVLLAGHTHLALPSLVLRYWSSSMFQKLFLVLAAAVLGTAVWAFRQDSAGMEMPQPGPEHKLLARTVGKWDSTMEMGGQSSKGQMTVELGPGGFTTFSTFNSDMMGMPFIGRGIDGYDANKKKFISVWTDNMTASPTLLEGTHDEKTNTLTMYGEMMDMTGKMAKHRYVTTWPDANTMHFEVFGPGLDGKEVSSFTITYKRAK
jgi:hypothetical protein